MTNCLQARLPTGETNMKVIVSHFLETADQRRKGKKVHLKCWSGALQCSTIAIFSIFARTFGITLFLVLGNIQMKKKSSGDCFKDKLISLLNSKYCFSRAWGTDGFLFFFFFFFSKLKPAKLRVQRSVFSHCTCWWSKHLHCAGTVLLHHPFPAKKHILLLLRKSCTQILAREKKFLI